MMHASRQSLLFTAASQKCSHIRLGAAPRSNELDDHSSDVVRPGFPPGLLHQRSLNKRGGRRVALLRGLVHDADRLRTLDDVPQAIRSQNGTLAVSSLRM